MKRLTALLAGITLAMSALPSAAGVVIMQKVHVSNGGNSRDAEQTISIEGNKQKVVEKGTLSAQGSGDKRPEEHTIITDLDKGMIYFINPAQKSYTETEFLPKDEMKRKIMAANAKSNATFKKVGTSRQIAGYKCEDYNGTGHVMMGEATVKECFSTTVPGAEEYSAFESNMLSKLKAAGVAEPDSFPEGVPLALDGTTKMGNISHPGTSADSNRPPVVTSTIVEKIGVQKLASDTFTVPTGFTKTELPAFPGIGMKMPLGGMKGMTLPPSTMKTPPSAMKMPPGVAASPAAP